MSKRITPSRFDFLAAAWAIDAGNPSALLRSPMFQAQRRLWLRRRAGWRLACRVADAQRPVLRRLMPGVLP